MERLVVTSSVVSIFDYSIHDSGDVLTEDDWLENYDDNDPYPQSKAMAEKAVWEYLDTLKEDQRFGVVIINPGFILGPLLVNSSSASITLTTQILGGKLPGIPDIYAPMVDVRDVAEAHVKAITQSSAKGRHITVEGTYEFALIGKTFYESFREYGYSPNKRKINYCGAKIGSWFMSNIKPLLKQWGKNVQCDNTKSIKELGMEYKDMKETLTDMGHSLIDHGLVRDRR